MLSLPHGCSCSDIAVHPLNWKTVNASVKITWYIHYRFYDPSVLDENGRPKCKQVSIKGMNRFRTREERKEATATLLSNEFYLLQRQGLNPIKNIQVPVVESNFPIDSYTPFIKALRRADEMLEVTKKTHLAIRSILTYVEKSAIKLGIASMPVSYIKRRDIRSLLDVCRDTKKIWSANTFNHYRAHLIMLFKKMIEYECIEFNPAKDIEKKKVVKMIRPTLSPEQRQAVDQHLRNKYYTFWRFTHIFFHSGGRETELLQLKGKDVDLTRQVYRSIIKKGREQREVERTIKDIALPLWTEILSNCAPEDYIFSKFLQPGPKSIRADQITKRWYKYVKNKKTGLGFTADFYSLKHLNTSETVDALDEQAAALQNAHTTSAMVISIYDVKQKERKHNRLKQVANSFA